MKRIAYIMNRLRYFLVVAFVSTTISCDSWLDLGSEDRIMESTLFSSQSGFMTALNGVYIELMGSNMYGTTLSYRPFDILAQYYDCTENDHSMQNLVKFDPSAKAGQVSGFWSRAYTLLVNVNTIIEACEEHRNVLSDQYYHVFKGEALALRALMHFELFKVFGPIYPLDREEECIPYASSSDLVIRPLLKASNVVELIMKDLQDAEKLLKEYDPVVVEGALYGDAGQGIPNDMVYRQMRLNYYAVKALIARVAIYTGDETTALSYAQQVITEAQEENSWFPFVTRAAATTSQKWDRIYKTEILFGLYNLRRSMIYENAFTNLLGTNILLRPTTDNIEALYEEDTKLNDWRYLAQWMTLKDQDANEQKYFVKYMGVDDTNADGVSQGYTYIMPIMRISEMYLIAAECIGSGESAYEYIDRLRQARGLAKVSRSLTVMEAVEAEFRREFIGEGQLFWFYKRQNRSEIPSSADYTTPLGMEKSYYLFDLPQTEKDKRNI